MNTESIPPSTEGHPEFKVHILNDDGITCARSIAQEFNNLLTVLHSLIGEPNREFSIVKTKLEEACFFAKKAMAKNPAYQKS